MPPERAARGVERLTHLLPSLRGSAADRDEAGRIVAALTRPARAAWIMARALALLAPYFERETPQAVREIEAEDWAISLSGYPEWAIANACRWWKGAENADRRRRPLEGDIAARCRVEMDAVRAAEVLMRMPAGKPVQAADAVNRCSRQAAGEIMVRAGFAPKRMQG